MSIIQFLVSAKLSTSSSFRSLEKIVVMLNLYLNLGLGCPKYGTILIWTKKVGLFSTRPPIEKSNDWVLIIDESIAVGHERLLVVYGVRSSKIDFKRALKYDDLKPLLIKSSNKWTGEIIKKEIEGLVEKWGHVKYIVADGGNGICKGLELSGNTHVYDITHKIAWVLKKIYEKDSLFTSYAKEMAQMRYKGVCSEISHIIPPKQRINSRFMNLDILSDWGLKAISCIKSSKKNNKIYKKLLWVKEYAEIINELDLINNSVNEIKSVLKTKGLSKKTFKFVVNIFKKNKGNANFQYLGTVIIEYLKETMVHLPKEKNILCTSDIIESSFGKYKNYMSQNSMAGITDLSLCMAAFTNSLDANELKEGLEKTKMDDLKKWSKENIGETNFAKRKRVLKNNGV